jgi:threonine dehydrogenase-like Zn-dependent dehydrogenase
VVVTGWPDRAGDGAVAARPGLPRAGLDFDADKLALARAMGAEVVDLAAGEDPVAAAQRFSRGRGVDAVIITASTKSNEPVHQAAQMCRKRGRIVLVGVTGWNCRGPISSRRN